MKPKQPVATFLLAVATVLVMSFSLPVAAASFAGQNLDLAGSATVLANGDLQLTNDYWQKGAAWLPSSLSTANSFSFTFSFSLQSLQASPMADGVALVLQNQGTGWDAVGKVGGNIGYTGLNAVGSVVQTWINNTAGVNTDGNAYDTKPAPVNLGLAGLVLGVETVSYNAQSHSLAMNGVLTVDGTSYQVNDSATVNLANQFGPNMYLGFTGGTGGSLADQRITSFGVTSTPIPAAVWFVSPVLVGLFGLRRRVAV